LETSQFETDRKTESDPENVKIIKLLLQYGADPNIRDKSKKLPIEHAIDDKIKKLLADKTNFNKEASLSKINNEHDELIIALNQEKEIDLEVQRRK